MAEAQIERSQADWVQREQELMKKIEVLEADKVQISASNGVNAQKLAEDLCKSKKEIDDLMAKLVEMEKQLKQKHVFSQTSDEIEKEKRRNDDLLTKAKELLFEKAKIGKKQECQIDALNSQLASLQDVLGVTREMLEIRNTETEHLAARLNSMETRLKVEKSLIEKKLAITQRMYDQLKAEYELQSMLFKELKKGYKQKIDILEKQIVDSKADKSEIPTTSSES